MARPAEVEEGEKVTLGMGGVGAGGSEGWNFHLARGARLIDYWLIQRIGGGRLEQVMSFVLASLKSVVGR